MNYTGGKFKLLPQIKSIFPKEIDTFVDVFSGGLNIGLNVKANKVLANDSLYQVIEIYEMLQKMSGIEAKEKILEVVHKYNLDKQNKEGFLKLRENYNKGDKQPYNLYALITHAFNNQIRFNKKGEYNMPFGKGRSSFNNSLQKRLVEFTDAIDNRFIFMSKDFRELDLSGLGKQDLVYFDPPYLISTATYNENDGWGEKEEYDLLNMLDSLDNKGVRFALSNVLVHNNERNNNLIEWSKKYNVYDISSDYTNASYQKKNRINNTKEVLVTNF